MVFGVNHKTAPVEIREKFSIQEDKLIYFLEKIKSEVSLGECVVLSTCNRAEIYCTTLDLNDTIKKTKQFFSEVGKLDIAELEKIFFYHSIPYSVEHLFKVTSGLDSMVIGENEVLGQVKKAYSIAQANKFTSKYLNVLFQNAIGAGKYVRANTGINKGALSLSSVAVDMAERIFGELIGKKVMVIGAGEMSELALKYLQERGVEKVYIANRTISRADELAQKFNGESVGFEDKFVKIREIDIVISSTSAQNYIIHKSDIKTIMPLRKYRPIFFIDLAVPRDIDEEVNKIENVYLYNIDDLQKIVNENIADREQELEKANSIIKERVGKFIQWFNKSPIPPLLKGD